MEDERGNMKGKVCVTGGTGFVASWLIMKLLQHGYSVNTTIRSPTSSGSSKRDISFLTNLPGASDKLHIFHADFDNPGSFSPAIEGCIGVFHVAHPIDLENRETEETITNKSVTATLGILNACLVAKTVRRVVYTSSAATLSLDDRDRNVLDEESWSNPDRVRKLNLFGASYAISKIATERAALEFAEKHCLDLVAVIPTWIHGPFITPSLPGSVKSSLAMFIGNEKQIKYSESTAFVHTDDVAMAHIFLFEYPQAKGRYICSALEITVDELHQFLSRRYPHYQLLNPDSLTDRAAKFRSLSSKKLLDTGFRYKYGLEEMFDDAIECCKKKGFL